jgi:acetolactate synthase regulatory subunit
MFLGEPEPCPHLERPQVCAVCLKLRRRRGFHTKSVKTTAQDAERPQHYRIIYVMENLSAG